MATTIVMEALSPTMEEGRVVAWHKHEGDGVTKGDVLAEVETDKAIMELVARADGTLLTVVAPEGTTVPVGEPLGAIGQPGETVNLVGAASADASVTKAAADVAPQVPAAGSAETASPPDPETAVRPGSDGQIKASPLARRMAEERGVDLSLISGSGPGGRIVKRDIESAPTRPGATPTAIPSAGYEDVPVSMMRKTIAKRLAQSIGPIPTFYLTSVIDMERAWDARKSLNAGDGPKISFNDIILKAVALTLKKHPACNGWWMGDHIRYWHEIHLGMAVAIEDGLITPVVRHADSKGLAEIAQESHDLASRARERRLTPEEYTGATFSVSNLGMFDIEHFTAVINPPEAGIIAIGSIAEVPVAQDGTVVTRRQMRMTMSCDHRVIDGATGAVFLQTLKTMLGNPLAMLL